MKEHRMLSPEAITEIRQRYARGDISQTEIAHHLGVSQRTVCNYVKGVLPPHYRSPHGIAWRYKLAPSQIKEIRQRSAAGERQHVIAKRFGVTQSNISRVINRVTWTSVG